MDRTLDRLARALGAGPRRPHPGPPPSASTGGDLAGRFGAALARVAGELVAVPDEGEARRWIAGRAGKDRVVYLEDAPTDREIREAEVGVDRADVLLAETGTVLRTYPTRESSRISLVPPVSVFLATPGDLVADLPAALARISAAHRAGRAYTVMITGPSRTADIEKQLVIPAHGPRELIVLMVG